MRDYYDIELRTRTGLAPVLRSVTDAVLNGFPSRDTRGCVD